MKNILFLLFLFFFGSNLHAQEDSIGAGHALVLDGVDDFIDLGDRYDQIQLPVTISAWIFLSPAVTNWAPVFVSQDNSPLYNGFWLIVQPALISIGYGDGKGENLPEFRRSKTASINNIAGRWVQITGIIRGKLDMDIYVNGVNVGGAYSGNSDLPMSSSLIDVAKIGAWYSNGQTFHFNGRIDEVRLWNRSLTQNEVRELMCRKLTGTESALIGWWSLNEEGGPDVFDKSKNNFNGLLKGGNRIYSGAPIGDTSNYIYSNQWSQKSLLLAYEDDGLSVSNIRGNPHGVHIYLVKDQPSLTDGLMVCYQHYYFGVYMDSDVTSDMFSVDYSIESLTDRGLSLSSRVDNSVIPWAVLQGDKTIPNHFKAENEIYRSEYISLESLNVDLGEDRIACDQSEVILDSKNDDPSITYEWSTGSTSSSIIVKETGNYSLKIQNQCGSSEDEIHIEMLTAPPTFSLGNEPKNLCSDNEIVLRPLDDPAGFVLTWNDGSHEPSLVVKNPGTYSVTVENICGFKAASILVKQVSLDSIFIPNVITPDGDELNQYFQLDPRLDERISISIYNRWGKIIFHADDYQNDWDGDNLPTGVYYYHLIGECVGPKKGSVSILR